MNSGFDLNQVKRQQRGVLKENVKQIDNHLKSIIQKAQISREYHVEKGTSLELETSALVIVL